MRRQIFRVVLATSVAGLMSVATTRADVLTTQTLSYTGEVVKVVGDNVQIRAGQNEFTVRRQDIIRCEIAKPEVYDKSLTAFRAGKNQDALTGFKSIIDRCGGLPLLWIEDSYLRLGDVQLTLKDYLGAKKTFDGFKTLYPKSVLVLDAKYARILFEQRDPEKALALVQGVLTPLLKLEYLTEEQEAGVAEGLILMGDCQLATGKPDDALDSYLKVVTLFDVDPDRTLEAKYKAGKAFEQRGNWKRAKQTYDDLLKENPTVAFADDAKKRLADLTKAHPE